MRLVKGHILSSEEKIDWPIAENLKMKRTLELVKMISQYDENIYVGGESGTGKSMISRLIHNLSPRKKFPFIEVNCGSLSDSLLESELFGHVEGAFTGAMHARKGKMEEAQNGTILLDDITSASINMQVKLLHVFENMKIQRVGDNRDIHLDVRFICASNKDLMNEVKRNRFREDLFYRINVVNLDLPPLRDRKEDILPLIFRFLSQYEDKYKIKTKGIGEDSKNLARSYSWPGNVRELKNTVARSVVYAKGGYVDLSFLTTGNVKSSENLSYQVKNTSLKENLESFEKSVIRHSLYTNHWNYETVRKQLEISRSTLFSKIRKYKLNKRKKRAVKTS